MADANIRVINITLNPFELRNEDSNFEIRCGENVRFVFSLPEEATDLQLTDGGTLQVQAINALNDFEAFAKEGTYTVGALSELNAQIEFSSGETAYGAQQEGAYNLIVSLKDASGNVVVSGVIPFKLYDVGYTGVVEPPTSIRDEIFEQIGEATNAAVNSVNTARDEALEDITTFTDPDGLLQKHEAEITELQSGKVDIGEHLFNVGKLRTCSPIKALPLSLCVTVESYDWDKMGVNPFGDKNTGGCCFYNSFGITNWTFPYILKGIRIGITKYAEEDYRLSISMGYNDTQANGTRIICFAKVPLEAINGKHTYIFAINESVINKSSFFADGFYFAIDGVRYEAIQQYTFKIPYNDLGSSGEYARVNTTYNFTSDSEKSHFQGSILYYDLKLFNFDITADGAPYTAADYLAGKSVPLSLRNSGGELFELADSRSAYQIKDLSGNGNHATIFGDVISRKNEDPTTMQVEYTWGSGVSTGAYIMGDTVTLPANAEIEVLAKASASATLSLGTSSSASTTFANAASVGTTVKSIAKFYTADTAQKLFATPSVAGLTINLTLKITSLK